MRKFLRGAVSVLMAAALSIPMFAMTAMAAEAPSVQIPVTIEITGSKPATAEKLDVVLTAEDKKSPMPEGTVDGTYHMTVAEAGTYSMGEISFSSVGIHRYTIHQTAGTNVKGTYDSSIYKMVIYVTNAGDGTLETTTVIYKDHEAEKLGTVKFTNHYAGGNGGGGDNGGGGGSDGDRPTTVIPDQETPLGPLDTLTGIIDGEIPLSALPQTGTLWWLVPILALAGIMMFLAGVIKGRRSHEEE